MNLIRAKLLESMLVESQHLPDEIYEEIERVRALWIEKRITLTLSLILHMVKKTQLKQSYCLRSV